MKLIYPILVFLAACSIKTVTCTAMATEQKDILGEVKKTSTCECSCPMPSQNVIDTGGIVGGILSLFKE